MEHSENNIILRSELSPHQTNIYSMKGYYIIYFEHRNYVRSVAKLCLENASRMVVFFAKIEYACDVISMFKKIYEIAFQGIIVL